MPRDDEGAALAARILQYLDAHPDAADTAQGIRGWWLQDPAAVATVDEVEAALDLLVRRGVMMRIERGDMAPVYRRARGDSGA